MIEGNILDAVGERCNYRKNGLKRLLDAIIEGSIGRLFPQGSVVAVWS